LFVVGASPGCSSVFRFLLLGAGGLLGTAISSPTDPLIGVRLSSSSNRSSSFASSVTEKSWRFLEVRDFGFVVARGGESLTASLAAAAVTQFSSPFSFIIRCTITSILRPVTRRNRSKLLALIPVASVLFCVLPVSADAVSWQIELSPGTHSDSTVTTGSPFTGGTDTTTSSFTGGTDTTTSSFTGGTDTTTSSFTGGTDTTTSSFTGGTDTTTSSFTGGTDTTTSFTDVVDSVGCSGVGGGSAVPAMMACLSFFLDPSISASRQSTNFAMAPHFASYSVF